MTDDHAYSRPRCPECRSRKTLVYDSRRIAGKYRQRSYHCGECGHRFKRIAPQ